MAFPVLLNRTLCRRSSLEGQLLLLQGSQSCQSDLYHTAQEEDMEDEEDLGRPTLDKSGSDNSRPLKTGGVFIFI